MSRQGMLLAAMGFTLGLGNLAVAEGPGNAANAQAKSPLGRQVANFTLKDHRGKEVALADFKDKKLVVVAFLGTECPLAKLYAPRLRKLAEEFDPKAVAFLGINANSQDSPSDMAAYVRAHELKFPVLKDVGSRLADQMGAVRTPEVFVLDERRTVRYWGRIDDQYGIGYARGAPTRQDLRIALDELLSGKEVSVKETEASGCIIGRARPAKPEAKVTYTNQIARILQNRCVECHRQGEIGPFELTKYEEVAGWAETIDEVVRDDRMPPWHADPKHGRFANDRRLTAEEKSLIHRWVADGAPRGDPKDLPKPRTFTTGWQLPREPDAVVYMREKPYNVPAEGEVRYQYFVADPAFKEDKWIKVAEVLPGDRAVVHHVLIFAVAAGQRLDRDGGGTRGFLVGYVPGLRPIPYPDGMAKRIPAGSRLVFQVHYTPNGTPRQDRTKVGFVLADPKEVKHEVVTTSAVERRLRIPPNDANYRVEATSRKQSADVLLLGLMPHMHVRGKSFFYEAVFPDNRRETLLDVPQYDFNWQTSYRLAEPKKLPAGTQVHCVAHYDNSKNNPSNPNPAAAVRWGDQTWEEMMIGYFDVAQPRDPSAPAPAPAPSEKPAADDRPGLLNPKEVFARLDRNGDGKISRDEVPERLHRLFDRLDKNGDKVLSKEELADLLRGR
jgi:peroxiredoxin/mono/diheme cytochrome c family protein